MKTTMRLTLAALVLAAFNLSAATLCVSLESTSPTPPYTTWATAATNIQDAVDAAKAGDTVRVTNGVYDVGSRGVVVVGSPWHLSRVVVTNSIRLESVNGPTVTVIDGGWDGELVSGTWVRCVYVGTNVVLSGFTLTNGYAVKGGGVYCEASGVVTNCTVTGNCVRGVYGGSLVPSVHGAGGGAYGGTLYNCTVTGNWAIGNSCGTAYCPAAGGGAYGSTLYNCTLTGNSGSYGGGASSSTLENCTLTGNSATVAGGGADRSSLSNCTLTGNSADSGGGVSGGVLLNCIVFGNTNGNYSVDTILNYCLTTPLPTNGVGNIAADPRFVNAATGDYHLRPNSPCIDAGTNLLSLITTDLDGEFRPWDGNRDGVVAFDIGAYEFRPSPATLYVSLASTNPVPPYSTWATAATNIQDALDVAEAGDTVLVTNGVYAVGSREVSVLDTNREPPQLESVGFSRVVVANSIRLESVNRPSVTIIDGERNAVWGGPGGRCVYLGKNAVLSGFTLRNGVADKGGGVFSEPSGVVTNCVLTDNWGGNGSGGGAYGGTLYNCTLTGNSAGCGGGATGCNLYNCVLTDNYAWTSLENMGAFGGGAYGCNLYNCTVTANRAQKSGMGVGGGGGADRCDLYNCTVTGNTSGGGVRCNLYNCTLNGNSTSGNYPPGGGARGSTLYNCTVTDNTSGGVHGSTLYNCTVTDNLGGGASDSTLYNCTVTGNDDGGVIGHWGASTVFNSIVYYNYGGNYNEGTTLNFCCTTPLPTNGVGNITGPPQFMDFGAGDYRLWQGSPCIDAGTNLIGFAFVPIEPWNPTDFVPYNYEPTDILGNTRFIDGDFDGIVAWDIGAYEFNSFPPPRFTRAPQLTANGWQLNITGAPNKWVRVQRSSDLQNWTEFWWLWMGTEGVKQSTDGDMGQRMMFYRVLVE